MIPGLRSRTGLGGQKLLLVTVTSRSYHSHVASLVTPSLNRHHFALTSPAPCASPQRGTAAQCGSKFRPQPESVAMWFPDRSRGTVYKTVSRMNFSFPSPLPPSPFPTFSPVEASTVGPPGGPTGPAFAAIHTRGESPSCLLFSDPRNCTVVSRLVFAFTILD